LAEERNLSQAELGRLVHLSGAEIGKVERALRWPPPGMPDACDRALDTGGVLFRLSVLLDRERRGATDQDDGRVYPDGNPCVTAPGRGGPAATAGISALDDWRSLVDSIRDHQPPARPPRLDTEPAGPAPASDGDWLIRMPAGQSAPASLLTAQIYPSTAAVHGRVVVAAGDSSRLQRLVDRPQRALVIATEDGPIGSRCFGLDSRDARRQLARQQQPGALLALPRAYELDELTYGVLRAVSTLEESLLADDGALAEAGDQGEGKVVAVMVWMRPGVAGSGFGRRRCVARCV
jgi:hypothetical protein